MLRLLSLLGIAATCASACNYVMSHPVRIDPGGAPGKIEPHQGAVDIGGGYFPTMAAHVRLPISDGWHYDLGGTWFPGTAGAGFMGARYTVDERTSHGSSEKTGNAFDVEFGIGGGLGGRSNTGFGSPSPSGISRTEEGTLVGGYVGGGAALHLEEWVAVYGRLRVSVSHADRFPTTAWWQLGGAFEFYAGDFTIQLGLNYGGYANDEDVKPLMGTIYIGIGGRFDVFDAD